MMVGLGALMVLPAGSIVASGAAVHGTSASASPIPTAVPVAGASHAPLATAHSAGPAAAALAGLPARLANVPWIASLTGSGPHLAALTSLPNLALLKHPATAGNISPFYVAQPAPLGVTDFGLGKQTYSYNVTHLMGEVTFNAPPNVTDPASTGVIEPAGQSQGYVGSTYEFGIQLNTVATNISIPGSDEGFFWTQNVVNWNDTGIHFVDDTFNLTSATQNPYYIAPGTILSGCGLNATGVDTVLYVYGGVFQCVGGTIPVSAASYPVTIQLYNNASVNAQGETSVSYGYHIWEAGTGQLYTGISDRITFDNPSAPSMPANTPGFSIDGFNASPAGLFRDAEIDLVGDIGGDNSVFRAMDATIQLEYTNQSSGGWQSVPSAYNFGGDTGETSTGIAEYWTAAHVAVAHQGPAMLYGLWGAEPGVSVNSGYIQVSGSIRPSYGFVFVSNTAPVLDPWGTGERDNMSWLPTTNAGTFDTYLPPLGGAWTSQYYVQAFAPGSAEVNGTAITGTTTSYNLRLPSAPGWLDAPLYMFSNAQASQLARNLTGVYAPPHVFSGLTDNMNFTFDHLNDYGFPTFVLFSAQDVTSPLQVSDIYQGQDSGTGNYYFVDYAGPSTGTLVPGPQTTGSLPYFTSGIAIFDGVKDVVSDQVLAADGYGLQLVLWQDTKASVGDITSELGSSGVWVGDSNGTSVSDVAAAYGGTAISDVGSTGTVGSYLSANGTGSYGVEGLSSAWDTFRDLVVTDGAVGITTGANYGAEVDYDSYYYLPGTLGTTLSDLWVSNGSLGGNLTFSPEASVSGVFVQNLSDGIILDDAPLSTVHWVLATGQSVGVEVIDTPIVAVWNVYAWDGSYGVAAFQSTWLVVFDIGVRGGSTAVFFDMVDHARVEYIRASGYSLGVELDACSHVIVAHLWTHDHSRALLVV